jgi:hypothetical protein
MSIVESIIKLIVVSLDRGPGSAGPGEGSGRVAGRPDPVTLGRAR